MGAGDYGEFQTVPIAVKARRLYVDGWYDISGKPRLCPAGTWIVQVVGGNQQLCIPDDVFREGYRPTDTKSEAMWKEQTNKIHPVWPNGSPIALN
jgi:hypothetical protein